MRLSVLWASGHRLAGYGVTGRSMDGWTVVPAEALAELARRCRRPGCAIDDGPAVTVVGPDGDAVRLDGAATLPDAARAATLLGQPDAAGLVHRALSVDSPFYDEPARVVDVCRAVGIPAALLAPDESTMDGPAVDATADVGFVLLRLDATTAAAEAPLARHSAWVLPMGRGWALHVWDGQAPRQPLPDTAIGFSHGANRFALAVWWAADRAGFLFARSGRAVSAHEWSPRVDLGVGHTAEAGRTLSSAFRVPDRALDVTSALRRSPARPVEALVELLTLLGVPTDLVGRTGEELIEAARSAPGAVHTPRLSPLRAVAHALRETPADTAVDRAMRERPAWYRLLNAAVASVMAFLTVVLFVNWRWGSIEWWWVALSAATTLSYAAAVRPGRRRRRAR